MSHEYGICWGQPEADAMNRAIASLDGDVYYAELGCAEGRTFSAVLNQLNRLGRPYFGYAVDQPSGWSFSHTGFDQNLKDYVKGVHYQLFLCGCEPFLRFCEPCSLSLALIDACHEKECAAKDFLETEGKVRPGGLVVFHDTAEYAQGIDIQPHRNLPIGVRDALKGLGLLDNKRPGWELVEEVPGNKDRDERGIVIVRRLLTQEG